jgi:hypothetical protein
LTKPFVQEKLEHFSVWCENLPRDRWLLYRCIFSEATRLRIPFAIGGGLAAMVYADHPRDTKDIDLYVQPKDREAMIKVVLDAGLSDYFDRNPYDRNWIFRSFRDDSIVDVMWAMANQRAQVDPEWLNGPSVSIGGLSVRLVRPEETLWSKLYVLQKDRCDWPDAINMLSGMAADLDWAHLMRRTAEDTPLLAALVQVFQWICPDQCSALPPGVLDRLGSVRPSPIGMDLAARASLLDGRPWFVPILETMVNKKQHS